VIIKNFSPAATFRDGGGITLFAFKVHWRICCRKSTALCLISKKQ